MRANANLFWILTAYFAIVGAVYAFWSWADEGDPGIEWAGTTAVALAAMLSAFIAFYLGRVHKAQGAELPEDRLDANIDDGDAELGFFSPWSWWPVLLAAGVALTFLGIAIGFWLAFFAAPVALIALTGWVYEYYRGNFAR